MSVGSSHLRGRWGQCGEASRGVVCACRWWVFESIPGMSREKCTHLVTSRLPVRGSVGNRTDFFWPGVAAGPAAGVLPPSRECSREGVEDRKCSKPLDEARRLGVAMTHQ